MANSTRAAALAARIAARSDMGRHRSNNEDNFVVFDLRARQPLDVAQEVSRPLALPGVFVAVADGMGGHNAGQVASGMVAERLPLLLAERVPAEGGDLKPPLVEAVNATNALVHEKSHSEKEFYGMGCTLTALWLAHGQAWIAQVGDSRCYRLRNGALTQLTRDQTIGNALNQAGPAGESRGVNKAFEGLLLQAMGAVEKLDVVVTTEALEPGDKFLLCSDGLYRVVTPEMMQEILQRPDSLAEKARILIDKANEGGGPDNVTTILCEIQKGEGG